jgi:hypothetical protein
MPKPRPTESKKEYIARAIPEMIREGRPLKEAQRRAFGFWETYRGKKKKKGSK